MFIISDCNELIWSERSNLWIGCAMPSSMKALLAASRDIDRDLRQSYPMSPL